MGRAVLGVLAGALLAAPLAMAGSQQADVSTPPALIVFEAHEAGEAQPSLSGDAALALEAIHSDSAATDIQLGYSNAASVLASGALSLELPSSSEVVFAGFEVEHHENDLVSLYPRDDAADTEITLVIQDSDVLGSVRNGEEVYQIQPLGSGLTAVYHYDVSQLRHHSGGWYEFQQENRSEPEPASDRELLEWAPDARARGDPEVPPIAADSGT